MADSSGIAWVFPGQGAQCVGMGKDLYERFDSARRVFDQADEALGSSLSRLCFEGPEDELRLTVNVQPAILTVSLACLAAAREKLNGTPRARQPVLIAGHSLGEYTALAAAGVIDVPSAIRLARERGRLMHQAGLKKPGGMAAVIGLDERVLLDVCSQTGTDIANYNCPGQLVISGGKKKLAEAIALAEAKGAQRTITLAVSGAFHTHLMKPAADGLAEYIGSMPMANPVIPIIANTTALPITTADEVKQELLNQLCHGVQWQRSIEYMVNNGIGTFVEIGPGKVLSGLIRRINRNVRMVNIGDAAAIDNLVCQGESPS
jgi:[acyl-carrier-protein] S-malonyltransferase